MTAPSRLIRNEHREVAAARVARAELAVAVVPPAICLPMRGEAAREVAPAADRPTALARGHTERPRLHEITTPVSVVHVSVDSTPSSLLPFCPQHHATFPVLIPHVCSLPALNVVNMTPPTT